MSIDYKAIADVDAGESDLSVAVTSINELTENGYKVLNGNELKMWAAAFPSEYLKIQTNAKSADGSVSVRAQMALSLIDNPHSHVDLNQAEVVGFVNAIGVSQASVQALMGMAAIKTKRFNITVEQLKKARALRARGEI